MEHIIKNARVAANLMGSTKANALIMTDICATQFQSVLAREAQLNNQRFLDEVK